MAHALLTSVPRRWWRSRAYMKSSAISPSSAPIAIVQNASDLGSSGQELDLFKVN